jgi:toxin ParE1/3/4
VNLRLVVRPQAEEEALAARNWYEVQRAGLGDQFTDELVRVIANVTDRPQSFPRVHGELRRAILDRFPYGVFFRMTSEEVIVLGVIHGRRHPRHWRGRP